MLFKLHAVQYHTLSRMAHDYLAIQGSADASVSILKWRNRPLGDIFKVLQILKSGYRIGHIHALEQAEAYIVAYMDELDDDLPDLE